MQHLTYKTLDSKVNSDIEKILKNFQSYKKIDFNIDINKEKSGKYIVDSKNNELVFIHGDFKSLFDYGGYFLNNSNMFLNNDKIKFIPNVLCNDNSLYYSSYFSESKLNDNDIICVDFQKLKFKEIYQNFRVTISNLDNFNFLYKYLNNYRYNMPQFHKWIEFILKKDQIYLFAHDGKNKSDERYYLKREKESNEKYLLKAKNSLYNFCLLDIELPQIFINMRNYGFKKDYFDNDVKYVSVSYSNINQKLDFEIEKKNILVCKKTGFIYLNPISIKKDSKILVFSKGNVILEYHSKNWNWIEFNKVLVNNINEMISIRIKISSLDRIRGIYLVS